MKNKKAKTSAAYDQGAKDADILIGLGLSIWALSSLSQAWGFRRKDAKESHKKLYRYCEGFNDVIEKAAKKKGMKIQLNAWNAGSISQDEIGK